MNFNPEKSIVLIGIMGVGKTTIGRRLARRIGVDFLDVDIQIERDQGCSISDYFEYMGEAKFRDLEKRTIAELLCDDVCVIATGGGAFMNEETQTLIKERSISIWLKAELDVLVERVSRRNTRPLLETGDKEEIMKAMIKERYPVYAKADITIQSDEGPHNKVVDDILNKLMEYES